ncbi:hypothetical protein ACFJIX_03780 [Roseateles sp. UC29_93]|uniref:hypothetical protein n=1 Tax=Roseateles sp. UC29_93 TaxID=3350177 RepID=UPI003671AC76
MEATVVVQTLHAAVAADPDMSLARGDRQHAADAQPVLVGEAGEPVAFVDAQDLTVDVADPDASARIHGDAGGQRARRESLVPGQPLPPSIAEAAQQPAELGGDPDRARSVFGQILDRALPVRNVRGADDSGRPAGIQAGEASDLAHPDGVGMVDEHPGDGRIGHGVLPQLLLAARRRQMEDGGA